MKTPRMVIGSDQEFRLVLNRQAGQNYHLGNSTIKVAIGNAKGEAIGCISTSDGSLIKDDQSDETVFIGTFWIARQLTVGRSGELYLTPIITPEGSEKELIDHNSIERVILVPAALC